MNAAFIRCFLPILLAILCVAAGADEGLLLKLTDKNIHDATLRVLDDGTVEIHTTGADPYLFTEPLAEPIDSVRHRVLAFQYFSTTGTNHLQVFVLPPLSETNSVMGVGLSNSQGWSEHAVDLKPVLDKNGGKIGSLRLDFGSQAGKTVQIRGLRLRALTETEKRLEARRDAAREEQRHIETRLRSYLKRGYPCRITSVSVDKERITVEGVLDAANARRSDLSLVEVPIYGSVTEMREFPSALPLRPNSAGQFAASTERLRPGPQAWDRLLSRWAIARKTAHGWELLSHARYPDHTQSAAIQSEEKPRSKKGLGGFGADRPQSDIDDLGICAVTVNIVLNGFMYGNAAPGRTPFSYAGRTWYTDDRAIAQLDRTLLAALKHRLLVSAIILLGQPGSAAAGEFVRTVSYPDADPSGIFVMPDVSSEEGLSAYAAALDFLARRYSGTEGEHGRIHHWILHNEVNAGWVWTNAGEKSVLMYMDLYERSMRTAYLIARQYNPWSRVFISLEHHWTQPTAHLYAGKEMLEILADYSHVEGDFDWAVAFHPYPQNLFEPKVWQDTEVTFSFETPKITFKNLEVLDAWMKQPRMRYLGAQLRKTHLSEQGLNSRGYGSIALRDQAAGMAYAWNKLKNLASIELFHYHNWVDNRGEGGLQIGLRRFPDDREDPLGKKPIWYVYQALGTPEEEKATAFALPVIGIKNWSEVHYIGEIR